MFSYCIEIIDFLKKLNLENLKNVFEILFWLSTLLIAFSGLKTWKKQLKGTIEYDVARKILLSVYKLRFGVEKIRNPFMSSGELYLDEDDLNKESLEVKKLQNAYNNRFRFFSDEKQKIFVDILESEVLWGSDLKNLVYELLTEIRELEMAIEDKIRMQQMSNLERNESYWKERAMEIQEIIYSKSLNSIKIHTNDAFGIKIQNKVIEIEKYILPFLNRK